MQTADRTQFHWDISLIQPLFTGFALTSQYEMTRLQDAIREEEKQQAILDIARDVKQAYFTVLLSQKMVAVAEDEVETLTAQRDDAQEFFDQGLIPRNDLLRSQVALASALQNREKVRADERLALINRLREIEDGVRLEITSAFLTLGVARANIETAQKALEQAQENWRIAKIQYDQQMVTSSDILDARAFPTQADSNYYRAGYGYLIALADLDRTVGKR